MSPFIALLGGSYLPYRLLVTPTASQCVPYDNCRTTAAGQSPQRPAAPNGRSSRAERGRGDGPSAGRGSEVGGG